MDDGEVWSSDVPEDEADLSDEDDEHVLDSDSDVEMPYEAAPRAAFKPPKETNAISRLTTESKERAKRAKAAHREGYNRWKDLVDKVNGGRCLECKQNFGVYVDEDASNYADGLSLLRCCECGTEH